MDKNLGSYKIKTDSFPCKSNATKEEIESYIKQILNRNPEWKLAHNKVYFKPFGIFIYLIKK